MEQLKKKRTQLKRSITRLYNFIAAQNANYNEIKVRIDELENIFRKYENIQDEIDILCHDDLEIRKEEAYRIEIEEMFFNAKSIYSSLTQENLDSTVVEGAAASTPQQNNDLTSLLQTMSATLTSVVNLQSSSINESNSNNNEHIRLPHIEIPDFDGNLSDWIRFRDLFNAMIDAKTNLSNVEKLEYLQTKLKGEASSIIKHLTPTNDNYRIAWDLVNKKYDRPDKIKETYIRLLVAQPSIKNGTLSEIKQFYNNTIECYNALTVLYESVSSWDPLLMFLIKEKLDRETITLWYRQQTEGVNQTFQKLLEFLESRVLELGNLEIPSHSSKFKKVNKFITMTSTMQSCPVCKKDHFLFACQQFKYFDIEKRRNVVRKSGLCFNCLKEKHFSKDCKSGSCKTCGVKHNTLLHVNTTRLAGNGQPKSEDNSLPSIIVNSSHQNSTQQTTILPTAVIMVRGRDSNLQPCRALIDTGAQSTLISEACVQRLKLVKLHDKTVLYGVGGNNTSHTRGKVQVEIFAKKNNRTILVQAYCLSNLTQYIPSIKIVNQDLKYFQNLELADPAYCKPNRIDVILGADVFPYCILGENVSYPSGSPIALSTIFGWVIMGNVNKQPERSILVAHSFNGLDEHIQRFWETEECNIETKLLTPDEEKAEQHFKDNVRRQPDGRYMVRLPFKANSFQLGESKTAAMRRLESMERQFCKKIDLKVEFHKFMNEYIQLDHMEKPPVNSKQQIYYMPHHAVLKPSSATTKLRVVFDASCKSSNNTSLNDHLLVGPTVQNDLYSILLKFRKYEIGFTADIEKMYRQVLMHPDDRSYQCILWRNSPEDYPTTYQLNTVTYGTASAPFLATRTLMQVAFDHSEEFPAESNEILNHFYVDDYMSSAPDLATSIALHTALCSILSNSGFNLRKWSTNSTNLLKNIDPENRAHSSDMIIDYSETVKTLGLLWNTSSDSFRYSVHFEPLTGSIVTKRHVLSEISRIFDPIGWLSPVLIKMKIFMQKLWFKGVSWDEELPSMLKAEWLQLQQHMEDIKNLQIPRWINYNAGDRIELHGFADSSKVAYAAAIYIRVIKSNVYTTTSLLSAKTKVTPIRHITLPRLELCAAYLMAKLMVKVKKALEMQDVLTFGWTDSTVVLAWLSGHPRRWKTFIANRTSYIINIILACQWNHITSKENPADLATRGISSSEIIGNSLWWKGPQILRNFSKRSVTTETTIPEDIDMEERKVIATTVPVRQTDLFTLFSSYNMLLRITALILRFAGNCKNKLERKIGFIDTTELQNAHNVLLRKAQQDSYATEIRQLTADIQIPSGNKLASLTPFLDDNGIMRVGGRLENASISYDQNHPYILHKNHTFTQLIVRHYHIKHLHAGNRQLQYLLGLKYWIPEVSQIVKRTVYQCTTCMRFRQKTYQQRMGDLPTCRLQPGATFLYVGIDFAGPLFVRSWKGRGSKKYKCWLAVFVCLNTKAIHIEAVTDLSTQAFLASLRRFTSRRGKPLHIYTDNGTNFVGCNQHLKEIYDFLHKSYSFIHKEMTNEYIQWHFIPPSAPNFGGVWEAGVKSVKFHLKRVLGNSSITYEELSTVLCQIECCLNSRPLCLKFEGDVDPLTPAHFFILRSMKSIPDENLIDINVNRLSRWQYIQSLVQQFWSKWSTEYLSQLQQRPKWRHKIQNLKVNDIVLLKEDYLPPTQWLIGRVTITHPGKDDIVRVVTIKTAKGLLKRPISKVCPLFLDD